MKKLKILSVFLAVITAFSCLTVISASAAEITVTSVEVVSVPDDILDKTPENLIYGIKVKMNYSGGTSQTYEVKSDCIYESATEDKRESLGKSVCAAIVTADYNMGFFISVTQYISDFISIMVYAPGENSITCEYRVNYPDDYECPEVFCNDYIVYKTNADDTLTVINHLTRPIQESGYEPREIVIPETLHNKTVTAIADYAFLSGEHPASAAIPSTVTQIGKYAFGYCIDLFSDGDNHMIPDNVVQTRLSWQLAAAKGDEKFTVRIEFFESLADTQSIKLMRKYFPDCTDYEYDPEEKTAYATITKDQIYSMKDVNYNIAIYPEYTKKRSCITDEIYDFLSFSGKDKVTAEISMFPSVSEDAKENCQYISNKYFGGRTNYTYDEMGNMCIEASIAELEKAAFDESVIFIDIKLPGGVQYDLYKKIYFENDRFTTDIFVKPIFFNNVSDLEYKAFVKSYFSGCKYEILDCDNQKILIIKDAPKRNIAGTASQDRFEINTFSPPLVNNYGSLVIYGESGSAAQLYAENNSIEFVVTEPKYNLGDVNFDGKVDVKDSTEILKYNVDLADFTDEQLLLADVDQNGRVNVSDASEIQRMVAGL